MLALGSLGLAIESIVLAFENLALAFESLVLAKESLVLAVESFIFCLIYKAWLGFLFKSCFGYSKPCIRKLDLWKSMKTLGGKTGEINQKNC